jgi:stage III sporulation protein AD
LNFFKIAVFVIAGVVLLVLTRKNAPLIAIICEISLVAVIILNIIPEAEKLISLFDSFDEVSSIGETSLKILFKTFGILAVGAVVADICRDNGEGAVAGVVELGMKILAVSCALPVFTAVVEIALTFF